MHIQTTPSGRLQNTPPAYLPAILTGDDREASAAHRMAQLRPKEGIGLYLLDGNDQFIFLRIIDLDDTIKLYARVVFVAQVGNCRIAYLALGKVNVVAVAHCKAAPGADRHKLAFHARSNTMQVLAVGEEVPLATAPPGAGGHRPHREPTAKPASRSTLMIMKSIFAPTIFCST